MRKWEGDWGIRKEPGWWVGRSKKRKKRRKLKRGILEKLPKKKKNREKGTSRKGIGDSGLRHTILGRMNSWGNGEKATRPTKF